MCCDTMEGLHHGAFTQLILAICLAAGGMYGMDGYGGGYGGYAGGYGAGYSPYAGAFGGVGGMGSHAGYGGTWAILLSGWFRGGGFVMTWCSLAGAVLEVAPSLSCPAQPLT